MSYRNNAYLSLKTKLMPSKDLIFLATMSRYFLIFLSVMSAAQMTAGFTKLSVAPIRSNARESQLSTVIMRDKAATDIGPIPTVLNFASKFTASTLYAGIETFIVIGLLAAIDGGFSGDWSKFGYITTDVEAAIRSSVTSVGLFHLVCAPIAAISTAKKGQPVVPAVLHTLAIGGLGLFRVLLQEEETVVNFPNLKQGFASLVAGEYDPEPVNQSIDQLLNENAVVMFSFTTCPYCIKAKAVLEELNVDVKVIELDIDRKVGFPIRAELCKRTGRASVPSIWIGGQFIGGCNDGPTTVTIPAINAVKKGFNILGLGDKTEAVAYSPPNDVNTKGGIVALNESGVLNSLLLSVKAI